MVIKHRRKIDIVPMANYNFEACQGNGSIIFSDNSQVLTDTVATKKGCHRGMINNTGKIVSL